MRVYRRVSAALSYSVDLIGPSITAQEFFLASSATSPISEDEYILRNSKPSSSLRRMLNCELLKKNDDVVVI